MAPVPSNQSGNRCGMKCEVYSRVCGYHRPTRLWNKGKQAEFQDRVTFDVPRSMENEKNREEEHQLLAAAV